MSVPTRRIAIAVALLALAGCASWSGQDARRVAAEARADDARCATATVAFPSEAYDHCRRRLMDQRQDKQRREVALGTQQSPYTSFDAPGEPEGIQRSIDPERFRCTARGEGDARLVLCEEQ